MSLTRHVSRAKILQLIMQHDAMKNTGTVGDEDPGGLSLFEFTSCQRLMANSISSREHFKSNQRHLPSRWMRMWMWISTPQMDLWPGFGFGCRVSCASTFVLCCFRDGHGKGVQKEAKGCNGHEQPAAELGEKKWDRTKERSQFFVFDCTGSSTPPVFYSSTVRCTFEHTLRK